MTTPLWTAREAARATRGIGGKTVGDWQVFGVCIDTRSLRTGDLFVALPGSSRDGHEFVVEALSKGAGAALIDRPIDGLPADAPILICDDAMDGMCALAEASRSRASGKVISVTGSVGKTSTKEALKVALSRCQPTQVSARSFNNHIGVPLTLVRLHADTAFGVLEMGMNHAGELEALSVLAKPDIAIITTVEAAHAEYFDSVEAIADAKAEIFTGITPGGTAILNRDNPHFSRLASAAGACGVDNILSFGTSADADVRLLKQCLQQDCSTVIADIAGQPMMYKVGAPGPHWVMNSLAVLATVLVADADLGLAGLALQDIMVPEGRGRRHLIPYRDGSLLVIDDSYNASPASMRVALETLGRARGTSNGRRSATRRIAVLGDMLELGDASARLHVQLAKVVCRADVDLVLTVGPLMRQLNEALPAYRRAGHVETSGEAIELLIDFVAPGDVVMVKGSNAMGLSGIVGTLLHPDTESAVSAAGE